MYCASAEGHIDLAHLLVEHGADAIAQDKYGWTPLHWALKLGHMGVTHLLIECRVGMIAQDNWVDTIALHVGIGIGKVAHLLLNNGADVTALDNYGWTPLEVAHLLIESGTVTSISASVSHLLVPSNIINLILSVNKPFYLVNSFSIFGSYESSRIT